LDMAERVDLVVSNGVKGYKKLCPKESVPKKLRNTGKVGLEIERWGIIETLSMANHTGIERNFM